MSVSDTATGEDDFGDVAVGRLEMIQPVTITTNVREVGAVKTGVKFCSRVRKESVLPWVGFLVLVSCCALRNQDKMPRNREEADLFFFAQSPPFKSAKRELSLEGFL